MKIISKYKDYYDFVGYHYGQDEKIVYNRKELGNLIGVTECSNSTYHKYIPNIRHDTNYYSWILICGRSYLLYRQAPQSINQIGGMCEEWRIVPPESPLMNMIIESKQWISSIGYTDKEYYFGGLTEAGIDVCREYKQPVLHINGRFKSNDILCVHNAIPNLGKLGFASVLDPHWLYQEISYFMGNIINESPDMQPRYQTSDKIKLESAGFDCVESFRHRKLPSIK